MEIPKHIEKCPVSESIFEIRYTSDYPSDAIFGIIYGEVKNFFQDAPEVLPIMQVPEAVRINDPNLQFQPYHKFVKGLFTFAIGPKALIFTCRRPYAGWKKWSDFIYQILNKVKNTSIIHTVERFGIRYVNIFESFNIFDHLQLDLTICGSEVCDKPTHVRTEIPESEGFVKIVQVGSGIQIIQNGVQIFGSLIDIDCVYKFPPNTSFPDNYIKIIEDAHLKESEQFYSLLKPEFIPLLNPQY